MKSSLSLQIKQMEPKTRTWPVATLKRSRLLLFDQTGQIVGQNFQSSIQPPDSVGYNVRLTVVCFHFTSEFGTSLSFRLSIADHRAGYGQFTKASITRIVT